MLLNNLSMTTAVLVMASPTGQNRSLHPLLHRLIKSCMSGKTNEHNTHVLHVHTRRKTQFVHTEATHARTVRLTRKYNLKFKHSHTHTCTAGGLSHYHPDCVMRASSLADTV